MAYGSLRVIRWVHDFSSIGQKYKRMWTWTRIRPVPRSLQVHTYGVDKGDGVQFGDRRRRFGWSAVQRFYDEGNSYRLCRLQFDLSAGSLRKAVKRSELCARARRIPRHELLDKPRALRTIKRHLLEAGILLNVCEECGTSEWRGKPLSIQIDHRNGIRDDHRFENLRMLCPNCHSQTDTFGARNRKRKREHISLFPGSSSGRMLVSDTSHRSSNL